MNIKTMELGNLYIPTIVDFDPWSKKISFIKPHVYSFEYYHHLECLLVLSFLGNRVFIEYHCDNNTLLSKVLGLKQSFISEGNLQLESFKKIQDKAIKVLSAFMDHSESEFSPPNE
ncbi:hypothetical protein CMT37_18555 [Elizabethkingia anophelis]|nr:hypothetical protein [Elizabethkingia anophelis]